MMACMVTMTVTQTIAITSNLSVEMHSYIPWVIVSYNCRHAQVQNPDVYILAVGTV